jgi:hypothetical protein
MPELLCPTSLFLALTAPVPHLDQSSRLFRWGKFELHYWQMINAAVLICRMNPLVNHAIA